MPWPLPALVTWAAAWLLFAALRQGLGDGLAVMAAVGLGTLCSLWGSRWWRRMLIALGFPLSLLISGSAALSGWAWLLPLALLLAVYPLNAWRDAPLFPTPEGALAALPARLPLPAGARVLDAGCGLGDGLRALQAAYPQAQLFGIEWSWPLRALCALRCPFAQVRRGDIWQADWDSYDLVYLFQRPESMERARLHSLQMRPQSWLVSLEFPLPEAAPTIALPVSEGRTLWCYQLPLTAPSDSGP